MSDGATRTLLVGIGAQRAGTTWLAQYLAAHPDVFMSPVKELHHFDARLLPEFCGEFDAMMVARLRELEAGRSAADCSPERDAERDALRARLRMSRDPGEYLRFFLDRAGERRVMCEITPSYSMLDRNGFAAIAATFAGVRFGFLMRNPIDRIWSQMRRAAPRTGRPIENGDTFGGLLDHPELVLRTDYRRTLSELFAVVPAKNVFLEFFERLFDERAIRRLCGFLDIGFRPGAYHERVGAAPAGELPQALRRKVYAKFARVFDYVHELFGGDIPSSWKQDMAAFG